MHTINEWIGFAVAISLAGALISALAWMSGRDRGIPLARLRGLIAQVWLSLVLCVAGLVLVRSILGGGIIDYNSASESPLAVRNMGPARLAWVAGGVVWMVAWTMVALRATRETIGPPRPTRQSVDEDEDKHPADANGVKRREHEH